MRSWSVLTVALAVAVLCGCQARPAATADIVTLPSVSPMDINVLANDTDPGDRPLIVIDAGRPSQGKATINRDSTIHYVPNAGAYGEDRFTYRIRNNRGSSATGRVSIRFPEAAGADRLLGTNTARRPETRGTEPDRQAQPAQSNPPAAAPASTATPPAPAPVPTPIPIPTTASTGMIQTVVVTLFTRDDDKNAAESIQLRVKRGETVLTERNIGEAEAWGVWTDRTEELTIDPPAALSGASGLSLEVRKVSTTPGPGESWLMQVDVQARLADGRIISLVPKSLPFRMGGGSSNNRTWQFKPGTP